MSSRHSTRGSCPNRARRPSFHVSRTEAGARASPRGDERRRCLAVRGAPPFDPRPRSRRSQRPRNSTQMRPEAPCRHEARPSASRKARRATAPQKGTHLSQLKSDSLSHLSHLNSLSASKSNSSPARRSLFEPVQSLWYTAPPRRPQERRTSLEHGRFHSLFRS